MINETNKIIVRVGKKSSLRFANAKAYRAITSKEMIDLASRHEDCKIVIIENIDKSEEAAVREFVLNFKNRNDGSEVLFYIPDNDDITSGIADELDYNIYMSDKELYKSIYKDFGINVSIYIDDRKELNSSELSESIPEGITDIFGGIGEEEESDISEAIASIDKADSEAQNAPVILNKDEEKKEEALGADVVEHNSKIEDTPVEVEHKQDSLADEQPVESKTEESEASSTDKKVELSKKEEAEEHNSKVEDTPVDVSTEHKEKEVSNENTEVNIEKTAEGQSDLVINLQAQLKDAKDDYAEILRDMREANTKIDSLEKIIRAITEEKEVMEKRYNELVVSDEVLEDPISLSQYSELKNNSQNSESQIIDLKTTINNLKATIESKDLEINSSETNIDDLKTTVADLRKQLEEAKKSLETNEALKEAQEEHNNEIKQIKAENEKIQQRVNVAEEDNSRLQTTINELNIRIESESESRLVLLDSIKKAIKKIKELEDNLTTVTNKKDELSTKLSETEKQLQNTKSESRSQLDKIAMLEKSAIDNDKKIEMTGASHESELNKLKDTINQLQTKLNVTRQQLEQKEQQYDTLVEKSGVDENGADALIQTNKALENVSKTLREQLGAAKNDLERTKLNEANLNKQIASYKNQIETLQRNMENIASLGGDSMNPLGAVSIRPLRGNSIRSQIISVFGSGSFGITTTAMSIVQKLSASSKVLYIDFDMMSPMGDAWFKKNPIIPNIPGTINGSIQNSGLGIFLEHGVQVLTQHLNNIVVPVSKTKGGGIFYLSGLYYTPDKLKLISANYEELFTTLGNIFQFIVIDFGKLGGNEIGDQLIKATSEIAYRNIVVTKTNFFEVRNFKNKLKELNIGSENIAWLFNMCTSTALDPNVKKSVEQYRYDMLPRMEQYNENETFLRVNLTRDRFGLFMDKIVFEK